MAGIVVGIDGSPESQKALRFALSEARVRGEELRAVSVWRYEPSLLADHETGFGAHDKDRVAAARTAAQVELDTVLAGARVPATELLVCEGDPAQVLIEESRDGGHACRRLPWPRRRYGRSSGLGQPRLCVARTLSRHGRPLILAREAQVGVRSASPADGLREVRTGTRRDAAS